MQIGSMKSYRIYSIDDRGSICGDRTIDAANDEEAVFAARSMQRPLDTEVWLSDRRIGKIPAHRG
jgi:hypothetical protein